MSRPPEEVLGEARWLAQHGVREIVLVSENSTSYGKDLGDVRLLERLLPQVAAVEGIARVRLTYLQPAEMRDSLIEVLTSTPGVVPYFDLSFQHASATVLRRMRRFGDPEQFLNLLARIRSLAPHAGVRSNVIVGFPGETDDEFAELEDFLLAARLDVIGIFGYSDEDGTSASELPGKVDPDVVADREAGLGRIVEQLMSERALERIGEIVEVLVDRVVTSDDEATSMPRRTPRGGPTTRRPRLMAQRCCRVSRSRRAPSCRPGRVGDRRRPDRRTARRCSSQRSDDGHSMSVGSP